MANDDYQFPTPAYSVFGWAWLAVGFVWALTVQAGARLYALVAGLRGGK